MGIKRKITLYQWDTGEWQIITRAAPSNIPVQEHDGTYMSVPLNLNELLEQLKWIDEHRDKILEENPLTKGES